MKNSLRFLPLLFAPASAYAISPALSAALDRLVDVKVFAAAMLVVSFVILGPRMMRYAFETISGKANETYDSFMAKYKSNRDNALYGSSDTWTIDGISSGRSIDSFEAADLRANGWEDLRGDGDFVNANDVFGAVNIYDPYTQIEGVQCGECGTYSPPSDFDDSDVTSCRYCGALVGV